MTHDEIREWFENESDDHFLKDEDIVLWHPNRTISAFMRTASLLANPADMEFYADHDVIYIANIDDLVEASVTEDALVYLSKCGVHYDTDTDGLAIFV